MKQKCDADVHTEHHSHLQMCVEPHWQTFGSSRATATADLIRLAGWLRCRGKPQALPRPQALCLLREAPAVLAALEMAGGVQALEAADMAAATCLARCLMDAMHGPCCQWVASDVSSRLTLTFAPLGPHMLSAAAAEVHKDVAAEVHKDVLGSMDHACTAVLLTRALLATDSRTSHPNYVSISRRQQASGVVEHTEPDIEAQTQVFSLCKAVMMCIRMPRLQLAPIPCVMALTTLVLCMRMASPACDELHVDWMAAGGDCIRLQWAAGCSGIPAVTLHLGIQQRSTAVPLAKQRTCPACAARHSS